VPRIGVLICIRKESWVVKYVSYFIDYIDDPYPYKPRLRANVECIKQDNLKIRSVDVDRNDGKY